MFHIVLFDLIFVTMIILKDSNLLLLPEIAGGYNVNYNISFLK